MKVFKQNEFDIVIDHSILRRSNIYKETDFLCDKAIKIRSSHFFDTAFGKMRRVYCADLLRYKPLVKKENDGTYIPVNKYEKHITFFIQTIFRKVSFRRTTTNHIKSITTKTSYRITTNRRRKIINLSIICFSPTRFVFGS